MWWWRKNKILYTMMRVCSYMYALIIMPANSPKRTVIYGVLLWYIHIKKSAGACIIARPAFRGLRIAHSSLNEQCRSPTPICIYVTTVSVQCSYEYNMGILHTLGHLPLQCSLATVWEVAKFWNAKNKALINAFSHVCVPTPTSFPRRLRRKKRDKYRN